MRPNVLIAVMLGAMVVFGGGFVLASCGGGDGPAATTSDIYSTTTQTTTAATTTTETTVEPEAEPTVVRVEVVNGAPKGGIVRKTVGKGDRVVLVVTSDVADEVHLHGYDISKDVAAGGTARVPFKATVPGRFEVELEKRGVLIADLTVQP